MIEEPKIEDIKHSPNGITDKILLNKRKNTYGFPQYSETFKHVRFLGKYCWDFLIILFAFFEDLVQAKNIKTDFVGLRNQLQKLQFERLEKDVQIWEKLRESREFITRKIRVFVSTLPLSCGEKEEVISCFCEEYSSLSDSAFEILSFVLNINIRLIDFEGNVKRYVHPATKNPKKFFFYYSPKYNIIRGILYPEKDLNINRNHKHTSREISRNLEEELRRVYTGISRTQYCISERYIEDIREKKNFLSNLEGKITNDLLKLCNGHECNNRSERILACNHYFCTKCLNKAYNTNQICPVCSICITNQKFEKVTKLKMKRNLEISRFSISIGNVIAACLHCGKTEYTIQMLRTELGTFLCYQCWNDNIYDKLKFSNRPETLKCKVCKQHRYPNDFMFINERDFVCMRCLMVSEIENRLEFIQIDSERVKIAANARETWMSKGGLSFCLNCKYTDIIHHGEKVCPKNHNVCVDCQAKSSDKCGFCTRKLKIKEERWSYSFSSSIAVDSKTTSTMALSIESPNSEGKD